MSVFVSGHIHAVTVVPSSVCSELHYPFAAFSVWHSQAGCFTIHVSLVMVPPKNYLKGNLGNVTLFMLLFIFGLAFKSILVAFLECYNILSKIKNKIHIVSGSVLYIIIYC